MRSGLPFTDKRRPSMLKRLARWLRPDRYLDLRLTVRESDGDSDDPYRSVEVRLQPGDVAEFTDDNGMFLQIEAKRNESEVVSDSTAQNARSQ